MQQAVTVSRMTRKYLKRDRSG